MKYEPPAMLNVETRDLVKLNGLVRDLENDIDEAIDTGQHCCAVDRVAEISHLLDKIRHVDHNYQEPMD